VNGGGLAGLAGGAFDLVVVGGGIHGAAALWVASWRGLRAALVEQGDFGHGASANSLKIIHGGLRYLQHGDFVRMRESIEARSLLLRLSPHLVRPLDCLMPTSGLGLRSRGVMGLALLANAAISGDRNRDLDPDRRLPAGRLLSRAECRRLVPGLDRRKVTGAMMWHDALAEHTERLTLALIRSAVEQGAVVANYVRASGLRRETDGFRIEATDALAGVTAEIRSRAVLMAAGPGAGPLVGGRSAVRAWVKGYNLVLGRSLFPECAVALEGPAAQSDSDALVRRGKRNLFFVPWRGGTMVGTLYSPYRGPADRPSLDDGEIAAFLRDINAIHPAAAVRMEDVVGAHVGLLPARHDAPECAEPGKKTEIFETAGGVTVVQGVKYTTAIAVGRQAIERLVRARGWHAQPMPAGAGLCGGERRVTAADVASEAQMRGVILAPADAGRLARNYGARVDEVIELLAGDETLRGPLAVGLPCLKAEAVHAIRREGARRLADVILRRTDAAAGVLPTRRQIESAAGFLAPHFGWSPQTAAEEASDVESALRDLGLRISRGG
jgi:glycerol-3-phosphate dehydrogenase